MQTSVLRPGLLVSLRTSIKGNVRYFTTELEADHLTAEGARVARWETERTVVDPTEHERALKARSLARSAVQTVCSHSEFGLLCLQENRAKLDAAIAKAEAIAREFNITSDITRVNVNVIIGEIAPDDVRAVRAINQELRDLMDTMAQGLSELDVTKVRNAADKARSVGKVLEPNAQETVKKALTIARTAAREIVKAGEDGAAEIDQVAIQRLREARTAFLDVDLDPNSPDTEERVLAAPTGPIPELTPEEEAEADYRDLLANDAAMEEAAYEQDDEPTETAPVVGVRQIDL